MRDRFLGLAVEWPHSDARRRMTGGFSSAERRVGGEVSDVGGPSARSVRGGVVVVVVGGVGVGVGVVCDVKTRLIGAAAEMSGTSERLVGNTTAAAAQMHVPIRKVDAVGEQPN
jgi:hypothetical protein